VGTDGEGQRKKVQDLVDNYNKVASLLSQQLSYNGKRLGPETLFGDGGAQSLQRSLGGLVARSYAFTGGTTSAARLGIKLNNDGTLTFDSAKFDAALRADPAV